MKARRLMTRDVLCILPETPLGRAWTMMLEQSVRHLLVTRDGRLIGMLSDRDVLPRSPAERASLTAGEVMTLNPIACPAGTRVSRVAQLMLEHRIDAVPIVSVDNQVVGLLTSTDLMSLLLEAKATTSEVPVTFRVSSAQALA